MTSYYELMEPESNFDEELARSELQRQTEELFSYIDLDAPEPNFADQIASPIAHDDCNAAQDPHVPVLDMLTDSSLPSSEQATGTSSSDTASEVPSQTHATVLTIAKPPITWNYTPPTTNPFFARALAFNAKALKKPLPLVARVSNEANATASFAAPAIVGSLLTHPTASRKPVSLPSPVDLLPHDGDRSILPPLADEAAVDTPQQLPQTESRHDIDAPSTRSDQLSLTELINKRREEHFRSHPSGECIDLTDDVSPSSGSSHLQESAQPPHITTNDVSSLPAPVSARQPAPIVETRTPSIQEIRDLMRQRPSSSKFSISSVASNLTSSAASATSSLIPNISPPRSITSNSTSSSNQSSSKSSSRRKNRSIGMASIEITSCNADVFRRIITPTAEISVRNPSLSPSEGRRIRRVVRPPSPQGIGAGADDVAVQLHDQSRALPELLEDSALLDDASLQGVTESIGSLDLHEHSRSPEVDTNLNQMDVSPLESIREDGYLEGIPVSAELMEHEELESLEMLVDDVSAESVEQAPVSVDQTAGVDMRGTRGLAKRTRSMSTGASGDSDQERLSVLMQLETSDGEAGDADHPISINSSRTVSSHTSSRQLSQSPVSAGPLGYAASVKQLEDGVEYYMGGYPVVTWNSYSQAQRLLPPKYRLAKDLPHELQDRVNALPQSFRDSPQATVLFEAMIDEAMDDELGAPPISIINEVTDEGAPPWEFNLKSCGCVGRCDPKSKTCGKGSLQFFGMPIFECNDFCGCDEDCPNRVVQRGRRYVVNIKRTESKGWGVFNGPKKIPGGSFIGIYAGELLTVEESDRRGVLYNKFGRTYLFDIDFHYMGAVATYSVDAYHAGNFTRFLNHSCDPNCEITPCYINEANLEKPLLTIFTRRDVEPFEELSFSYMGCIDDDMIFKAKNAKKSNDAVYAECHCGSANCLGVLFS
ncbi:hypothetical protein F4604DRAFT_1734514 [Suillus subluteus]|nr:hypothetical protein F4604DRAFT_1734514 [Suillus subluteus]